jgi:hypothetical protein
MSKLTHSIFAAGLLLAASQAQALVLSSTGTSTGSPSQPTYQASITDADVGQSFTLYWDVPAGTVGDSALPVDLTATITFTINAFNVDYGTGNDTLSLGINIANTTDLSAYPGTNSAITSFGFGVTPDATATIGSSGSVFDMVGTGSGTSQNYPGGFSNIDVCIFADGCSGGNVNDGLQAGSSDSLTIDLTGNFDLYGDSHTGALALFDFPLKFQGTWGSFETPGQITPPPPSVPEPGTLALLGIALFAVGLTNRRRKAQINS